MIFRFLKIFVSFILIATPILSVAHPLPISDLPNEHCGEDWNSLIMRAGSSPNNPKCVLEFVEPESHSDSSAEEAKAIISLNGQLITIIRTQYNYISGHKNKNKPTLGNSYTYSFLSQDKLTKVILKSHVVQTSCSIDTESCCGDDYEGTLLIEKNGQKTDIAITYYRGG
jgi:hypothetical protein